MSSITLSSVFETRNVKEMVLWETVTCGDTGSAYEVPDWADSLTVQALGTFTDDDSPVPTGVTLTIQGSNDGTTWSTLHADDGTAITFTAAGIEIIVELPRYVRPSLSTSGSSPEVGGDVDVYLFARKT